METAESKTLIDALLQEQHLLTAITQFAQKHEAAATSVQERYYRDLLPLSAPRAGEQYAFEVELDKCSGCKACVAACHSLNGLEKGESWRSVGLLITEEDHAIGFQQTVTTACHHCVDPACLNGCPVLAYEKDAATGIVRHLDDQCIGCQYCVLKCPYEVPRYSDRLGIVRKCDMCHGRLHAGEAPACVQSCPSEAIRITVVDKTVIASEYLDSGAEAFLPATPDPSYTLPTTRYISARELPAKIRAADEERLQPSAPHWPLVLMLVLTQAGIGGLWFEFGNGLFSAFASRGQLAASGALIFGGLLLGILHLGRPFQAWRCFMGVRRSWLSREIITFGALAANVLLLMAAELMPLARSFSEPLLFSATALGAAALVCSMMVYIDTPREFWNWRETGPRFFGSTVLLGAILHLLFHPASSSLYLGVSLVAALKLALEMNVLRHLSDSSHTALKRTALLLTRPLAKVTVARFALLLFGGVLCAKSGFAHGERLTRPCVAFMIAILVAGEIAERFLFFRSVSQPKMPGGVS